MIKVGIDKLAFYTSNYVLDLKDLAHRRSIDPNKFLIGLGQQAMAVPPPGEDIVTLAANAAVQVLTPDDISAIDMLLFATESGIDQSKSAGIYLHDLLGLAKRCRIVELKQACYSGTFALQLAIPYLRQYPDKKVLVIVSDIARYGLGAQAESSQGCGAAAMLLSSNPTLLALDSEFGVITENVMDFWRPNYTDEALVEGKYSSKLYLQLLEKTWQQYCDLSRRGFYDHTHYCYHAPVPRLVEKAHLHLAKFNNIADLSPELLMQHVGYSLKYNRLIGNSYTASMYIGLASLLDEVQQNLANQRIGFYSYGSGCVVEFFSGVIQPAYAAGLCTHYHQALLANRQKISCNDYEDFYSFHYPQDGSYCQVPIFNTGRFRLVAIENHKRIYEKVL